MAVLVRAEAASPPSLPRARLGGGGRAVLVRVAARLRAQLGNKRWFKAGLSKKDGETKAHRDAASATAHLPARLGGLFINKVAAMDSTPEPSAAICVTKKLKTINHLPSSWLAYGHGVKLRVFWYEPRTQPPFTQISWQVWKEMNARGAKTSLQAMDCS
ncbi:hypothetical protein SORBI_3003G198850 [Sorghum bicolor]|uniref:Uncharacterized protein n=1 Tax=Sorghum bicolor TaxID=4558 RepID=A0A1W0VY54_SORBI|nr:hypothetical protein SORBI_3003G198850 [Sorghum bicolor]